jgi:microcystin-dependent protein
MKQKSIYLKRQERRQVMKKSLLVLIILFVLISCYALPQSANAGPEPFLGEIIIFAGNFAPRGWAFCDGQLLPIAQNSALFSLLGTTYGGDGRTTFALPDLRGRVPLHPGIGPGLSSYSLGQRGGVENNLLTVNQMPAHNHDLKGSSDLASATSPAGSLPGATSRTRLYSPSGSNVDMATDAISEVGGTEAVENRQPYLGVNYIIAIRGSFPSRN